MIDESFHVEVANWERDRAQLRAVRESVFIVEQRVPEDEEWDALDASSVHALARAGDGTPIGTGRLTPHRTIGRMAVMKDWRHRGVGDALLRTLLEQARARGWRALTLHSQTHAIAFYQRHGFAREGDEFEEAGIPHFTMRARLDPAEGRPATALPVVPDSELLRAETALEAQACIDRIARDARHRLWLYTRDLDRALLDREAFIDQARRLSLSGRGAGVRVLLHESAAAVRDGHRLLHFAARMSSYVQLRKPVSDDDRHNPAAFVLNDVGGYFHRTLASRFDGEGKTHGPGRHRQLLEYFSQVWERSEEDPELRRMAI